MFLSFFRIFLLVSNVSFSRGSLKSFSEAPPQSCWCWDQNSFQLLDPLEKMQSFTMGAPGCTSPCFESSLLQDIEAYGGVAVPSQEGPSTWHLQGRGPRAQQEQPPDQAGPAQPCPWELRAWLEEAETAQPPACISRPPGPPLQGELRPPGRKRSLEAQERGQTCPQRADS